MVDSDYKDGDCGDPHSGIGCPVYGCTHTPGIKTELGLKIALDWMRTHGDKPEVQAAIKATEDTRNIQDRYKGWETDLIARDLETTHSHFNAVFLNVTGDFNKSSGVRNTNWFNGETVAIVGEKKWDRRGSVGTQNYTQVFHQTLEDFKQILVPSYVSLGYTIVAAEIDDRAVSLVSYEWPEDVMVIFGEEGAGLSEEILDLCDDIVYCPGRGSVRSLNVATTSGIFLYDYSVKRGYIK